MPASYRSTQGMMKKTPGPRAPPRRILPSRNITVFSYSWTTFMTRQREKGRVTAIRITEEKISNLAQIPGASSQGPQHSTVIDMVRSFHLMKKIYPYLRSINILSLYFCSLPPSDFLSCISQIVDCDWCPPCWNWNKAICHPFSLHLSLMKWINNSQQTMQCKARLIGVQVIIIPWDWDC